MPNYSKQIQKIKISFPTLKNHKIIVKETKIVWGARAIYLYFFSVYVIGRGAEKGLTKGGIAHELSHIEMFKKWGFWKSLLFYFLQYFSTNIRRKIEAGADINAIERGYGKELYQIRKKAVPKKVRILLEKYYLSLEEIKKYTKNQMISY